MRGGRSQILYQYQFRDAFSDGVGQTAQFPIAEGTVQGLRLFIEVAHHQRNASGSLHTGHGFDSVLFIAPFVAMVVTAVFYYFTK